MQESFMMHICDVLFGSVGNHESIEKRAVILSYILYTVNVNILLLGSSGYLGEYFKKLYPKAQTPRFDIADQVALRQVLDDLKPEVIINCAGKTGRPNVDWCEDHKEETLRANVIGPLLLLDECLKRGIYLVHISSGCIYEGDNGGKGFSEEDPPNFFGSYYSRTKSISDQAMKDFPVLTLRLRMPFDGTTSERNLIMKLRKYSRVLTAPNAITYLPDLLNVADALIKKRATGIYNVVNKGIISPYQIMELYKKIVDPKHTFEKLTLEELPDVATTGRSNCMLSTAKLEKEGIPMPTVEESLTKALTQLKAELH